MNTKYEKGWNTLSEIKDTLDTIDWHFKNMHVQILQLSQLDGPAIGVTDLTKEGAGKKYLSHLEDTLEEVKEVLPEQLESILKQFSRLEIAVRNSVDEALEKEHD